MPEIQQPSFDAPIAGQSLTAEVGSRPWQNPAQYSTLDDALDWYLDRFDNDEVITSVYSFFILVAYVGLNLKSNPKLVLRLL